MDKTEEFYNAIGSDFQSVAKRFGNNSAILTRFVLKFLSDESFRTLRTALEKDDAESAFYAAHTLKGICSNLGFDRLFEKSSAVTEMLRRKETESAKVEFAGLEQEYNKIVQSSALLS